MASKCSRIINRASISSFKSAIKSNIQTASKASIDRFSTKSTSSPLRRFSLSRSPSELGSVQSLLPLHSAVAAARMTSCLEPSFKEWQSSFTGHMSFPKLERIVLEFYKTCQL